MCFQYKFLTEQNEKKMSRTSIVFGEGCNLRGPNKNTPKDVRATIWSGYLSFILKFSPQIFDGMCLAVAVVVFVVFSTKKILFTTYLEIKSNLFLIRMSYLSLLCSFSLYGSVSVSRSPSLSTTEHIDI